MISCLLVFSSSSFAWRDELKKWECDCCKKYFEKVNSWRRRIAFDYLNRFPWRSEFSKDKSVAPWEQKIPGEVRSYRHSMQIWNVAVYSLCKYGMWQRVLPQTISLTADNDATVIAFGPVGGLSKMRTVALDVSVQARKENLSTTFLFWLNLLFHIWIQDLWIFSILNHGH